MQIRCSLGRTPSRVTREQADSSIEIWNEGELPEGYTQETLFARHSSKPRNHKIANVFFKAGFIDTWGRGFQKIRDGFEADGIPMPRIENFCGGVRVTIKRTVFVKLSVSDQTSGQTSGWTTQKSVQKSVQKSAQKIVDFISENPNITTQEMANLLGINRSIVARHIKTLQEKGIIQRVGPDKGGHWEILS